MKIVKIDGKIKIEIDGCLVNAKFTNTISGFGRLDYLSPETRKMAFYDLSEEEKSELFPKKTTKVEIDNFTTLSAVERKEQADKMLAFLEKRQGYAMSDED